MKRQSLYFIGANKVKIMEEELPLPAPGQVQVRSLVSAISAGTELMIYKGEAPQDLAADTQIAALSGSLVFPLKYGYSMVGEVLELGQGVGLDLKGKQVFAFNPHESAFNVDAKDVQQVPDNCSVEDAAFLANMETAVSLIHDGLPILGEKIVVLGQGLVGLLVTVLLSKFPVEVLTIDGIESRRKFSTQFGATESYAPDGAAEPKSRLGLLGADLVYEVTGRPENLNLALDLVGQNGRIVVGSWYGTRTAPVNLGEKFHRGRIKIISSQVSQIDPVLRGRWDKARRFAEAWRWVQEIGPSQLVTHRFPFNKAADAYQLLANNPEDALGVLFEY